MSDREVQKKRKHLNHDLHFDFFHVLVLGYFLPPQFLIYHFLVQITLFQHLPFVEFNPDTQENKQLYLYLMYLRVTQLWREEDQCCVRLLHLC